MLEVIENGRDITFSESVTVITSTLLATHFHDINKIGRIQSIHIPESITSIQAYALNHIGIQHIILPKTLQVIEPYVFNLCINLRHVQIQCPLRILPAWTFANCPSLERVDLPDTIEELGNGAFFETGLQTFTLPEKVTVIPKSCFKNSPNLTCILHTDIIEKIQEKAFSHCNKLKHYIISATTKHIEKKAFAQCTSYTLTVESSASTRQIGEEAFIGCESIHELNLENLHAESLKPQTFANCRNIAYIHMPIKNIFIDPGAFKNSGSPETYIVHHTLSSHQPTRKPPYTKCTSHEHLPILSPSVNRILIHSDNLESHSFTQNLIKKHQLKSAVTLYRMAHEPLFIPRWIDLVKNHPQINLHNLLIAAPSNKQAISLPQDRKSNQLTRSVMFFEVAQEKKHPHTQVDKITAPENGEKVTYQVKTKAIPLPLLYQFLTLKEVHTFSLCAKKIIAKCKKNDSNPDTPFTPSL